MSSKRKLRRVQAQQGGPPRAPAPDRDKLRRQTAAERFAKAGSDKLWLALLGWSPERQARIWLAQSIHDGARAKDRRAESFDPSTVISVFEKHAPDAARKLDAETTTTAVDMWLASGDGYAPDDPAPKWHYLATLAGKLELGAVSPEELQDDWEAWIGLALASSPRAALMHALGQAEQAAVQLHAVTRSDRIAAVVNLSRAMWTALAYGDETSFELLRRSGDDWLAAIAKQKTPE